MSNKIIFMSEYSNDSDKYNIRVLEFKGTRTIFELMTIMSENGIKVDFPCGGKKTCKKCKVAIKSGFKNISELCETEKQFLSKEEIEKNIRFACMCEVFGDIEVELNKDFFKKNKIEIQTEGLKSAYMFPDSFKKITVKLEKSTLENPIPDDINFIKNLKINVNPPQFGIIKKIYAFRETETDVILNTIHDNIHDITDIRPVGECEDIYGAAVDIGTTTVAVYLYSLTNGELIGVASAENPQRTYGADVISRINYIIENSNGLDNLKNLIISLIFKLTADLCIENGISAKNVYSFVFTGNTVMQHIAAGISPRNIAFTPFIAATLFDFDVKPSELISLNNPDNNNINIDINENAKIYFPPSFASYVGGDIAAGIIASDTDLSEKLRLFLDIGTNGEIGLGNKESLVFCATAAGPAFEGAHIKLGMAGIKGAINKIYLNEEKNKILYETIGGENPTGICGSGIIDAVALMLEIGVLDETGRILDSDESEEELPDTMRLFSESLQEIDGENSFILCENIYITQKDVREIQLAKASVCAGITTLLHHSGKSLSDICEVVLAGGFGAHINKKSACKIGLIPQELEDKIIIAGNTAGTGAAAVLLNNVSKNRIKKLSAISNYIELSGDSFFMDEYVDKMMF